MEKKRIQSLKARIRKAQTTLACMGDMILMIEIDQMSHADRLALQAGLKEGRIAVSYKYLDDSLAKASERSL